MKDNNGYMQRSINWKKIRLLYRKKAWLIIMTAIFAAVLAAGCYRVVCALTDEGQFYRVSSDYYITFNFDEYENSVDYYNAYTWDNILRDDPIVDEALVNLPKDYTKDEVKASITGEMLGDYRILTVHSTHMNPERARTIAEAYVISLGCFADKIEMLDTIELWSQEDCIPVEEADLTANASVLGALLGLVTALIICSIHYVLDDSIYLESDFAERFDVPFMGTMTRKGSDLCKQELKDNLSYLLKEENGYHLVFAPMNIDTEKYAATEKQEILLNEIKTLNNRIEGSLSLQGEDLEILRKSNGAVLMLPWGSKNGNIVEKTIAFLQKQDCRLVGAIVYDADDKFLKRYYGK